MRCCPIPAIAIIPQRCLPNKAAGIIRKADPQNLVMRKYSSPFWVEIKEDALLYRHKEFLYMDIRAAAAYKNFLFIKADRRWLVIKADKDEKQAILSKITKKTSIRLTEEKEAFDLRKL